MKDNKYTKTYYKIIQNAVFRNLKTRNQAKKILGYVEQHHIKPVCIGGTNDPSNLVFLTAKEHFVCHHLLTKMFDDVEISRKMRFALNKMISKSSNQNRITVTGRLYDKIRREFAEDISKSTKGKKRNPLSEEHKRSISSSSKGHTKTEETKVRMRGPKSAHQLRGLAIYSASKKGKLLSEEEKKKLRKPKKQGTSEIFSAIRKGIVSAFDLTNGQVVKIMKDEFDLLRGVRYVGLNSKLRIIKSG